MNTKAWFKIRGFRYVRERAEHIRERYGFSPTNIHSQIERCVSLLDECGGAPTLFASASLVERYPPFFKRLQAYGAEMAVHSYSHIDLRQCSTAEAVEQNVHGAKVLREYGFGARGFRCPYLSCTEELLVALPPGLFEYSSNNAIQWQTLLIDVPERGEPIFNTLEQFYHPVHFETTFCLPRLYDALVELPVIVPDDLQLLDGLHLEPGQIAEHWWTILTGTHARGEMFDLIFHLELASLWGDLLAVILERTKWLKPAVWVTQLCEVNDWWREKMQFRVRQEEMDGQLRLAFQCSSRGSILARGINKAGCSMPWDGVYERLLEPHLELPAKVHPFVGIEDAPPGIMTVLREHGYIVATGQEAHRCSVVLNPAKIAELKNEVELVNFIESAPGPLVKFNAWPDGAKSALAITGDMDALTLWDYTERLIGR